MKVASVYSKKSNNKSAVRSRKSHSVQPQGPQGFQQTAEDLYDQDHENTGERPMHLVPCRWRKDGWKYVEADTSGHRFFTNPNRINAVGMSPTMKDKMMERYAKRGNPQQTPSYF